MIVVETEIAEGARVAVRQILDSGLDVMPFGGGLPFSLRRDLYKFRTVTQLRDTFSVVGEQKFSTLGSFPGVNYELLYDEIAGRQHRLQWNEDSQKIEIESATLVREGFEGRGLGGALLGVDREVISDLLVRGRDMFPDARLAVVKMEDYSRTRNDRDNFTGWCSRWAKRLGYEYAGVNDENRPVWKKIHFLR